MNRRIMLRATTGLAAAAALAACARTAPLQEGGGEFIGRVTLAQRAEQIQRAGARLGWVMESRGPGLMRGTLNLRSHQALADIPYDTQRFAIRYAGSTNLNYDGAQIHPNYNGWVQNLQRAIISQSVTWSHIALAVVRPIWGQALPRRRFTPSVFPPRTIAV